MANPTSPTHAGQHTTPSAAHRQTPSSPNMWARSLNMLLGGWLFVSTFAWLHMDGSRTNTWVVGLLIMIAAFIAGAQNTVRIVNTALAVWLALSTLLIFHGATATFWNNLIVAIAVFVLSLFSNRTPRASA